MPTVKYKELKEIGKDERTKKLSELNLELVKAKSQSAKGGSAIIKEINDVMEMQKLYVGISGFRYSKSSSKDQRTVCPPK